MSVLKLDFDQQTGPDVSKIARTVSALGLWPFEIEMSRSTRNFHVIVRLPEHRLSPVKIVALQLLLGSDPRRELYNLYRVTCDGAPAWWKKRWNVLFERNPNANRKKA